VRAPAPRFDAAKSRSGGEPRRVLAAVLSTLFSFAAASCLGVLDLDDYASAPDALCGLLDRCYGDEGFAKCEGHVSSQLAVASVEDKQSFLEQLSEGCLDDCKAARRCLDLPPICRAAREPCTTNEQCCGFSGGLATCSRQSCCRLTGASCKQDIDCCNDKCEGDPPTCGGTACLAAGEACAQNFECCTGVCIPGSNVCSADTCQPDGFECAQNFECCGGLCQGGTCATPTCKPDGKPCLADANCCNQQDGCDAVLGICGAAGCLPEEAPCDVKDDRCCGELFCEPGYERCAKPTACTANGDACTNDDECCILHCDVDKCACANDGASCYESFTCCSGACVDGVCGPCKGGGGGCKDGGECCSGVCSLGSCCNTAGCNHGICQTGGSLTPAGCSATAAELRCIEDICAVTPSCCCDAWDAECVALVGPICQLSCLGLP